MNDRKGLLRKAEQFNTDFNNQFASFAEESHRHERDYFNESPRIEEGLSNVINAAPKTTKLLNEITKSELQIIDLTSLEKSERGRQIDTAIQMHWTELKSLDMRQVEEEYWEKHNPQYLTRLNNLALQLNEQEQDSINKADTIVVIPAMNEFSLHETLMTLDASLQPTKLQKRTEQSKIRVDVIIYFNFKEEESDIPDDVKASLEHALEFNKNLNIHIIKERVPEDNTVQDSKKVALDLGLKLKSVGKDIPILMLDADIVEISHGLIQKLLQGISKESQAPRAISSYYQIPKSMLKKYPAMYYYFMILNNAISSNSKKDFEDIDIDLDSMQKAYGGFLFAQARTYMQAGGFLPYRNTFEDTLFIFQLECLMNGSIDTIQFWPVDSVNQYDPFAFVATNYTREMKAVLENKEAMVRWGSIFDTEEQNKEAGSRRADFSQIDHPLLKMYNLNGKKEEMFKVVIEYLINVEFKDEWETNYAMQSVVFISWIKVATEAGMSKGRAVNIWTEMFPNFKQNMHIGRLLENLAG